eukprot:216432_1
MQVALLLLLSTVLMAQPPPGGGGGGGGRFGGQGEKAHGPPPEEKAHGPQPKGKGHGPPPEFEGVPPPIGEILIQWPDDSALCPDDGGIPKYGGRLPFTPGSAMGIYQWVAA